LVLDVISGRAPSNYLESAGDAGKACCGEAFLSPAEAMGMAKQWGASLVLTEEE